MGATINHEISPDIQRRFVQTDIDYEPVIRCEPLTSAARGGHLQIVQLLVEHGADLSARWNGENALSVAAAEDVREFLKARGMT